jgi:hypothetical protein
MKKKVRMTPTIKKAKNGKKFKKNNLSNKKNSNSKESNLNNITLINQPPFTKNGTPIKKELLKNLLDGMSLIKITSIKPMKKGVKMNSN